MKNLNPGLKPGYPFLFLINRDMTANSTTASPTGAREEIIVSASVEVPLPGEDDEATTNSVQ